MEYVLTLVLVHALTDVVDALKNVRDARQNVKDVVRHAVLIVEQNVALDVEIYVRVDALIIVKEDPAHLGIFQFLAVYLAVDNVQDVKDLHLQTKLIHVQNAILHVSELAVGPILP